MSHNIAVKNGVVTVESELNTYFERSIKDATAIDPSYGRLWEELYALIRSGGKRLRSQMTLLSYSAYGGDDEAKVVPIAAAQELLHLSLLIHDDIIDRDYTRYGTLNITGRYKNTYSKFLTSKTESLHFADSAAILAGDLMLAGAHQLVSTSALNEYEKAYAHSVLSKSIFEVAGGELLDTESSFVPYKDGDAIKIARYKTAGYSFSAPLALGAKLAGAKEDELEKIISFATYLGIAYQLVDDLLGVFGKEEATGKSVTSDITEGKRTYMVEKALSAMTILEKDRFHAAFGNHEASEQDIDMIKQLLVTSGAKLHTETTIKEYSTKAVAIVRTLAIDEDRQEMLNRLIQQVTKRAF